jgi:hypothetical protein
MGFADEQKAIDAHARLMGQMTEIERDGSLVRLTSNDGARQLMEVLRVLGTASLEPDSLTVREPSLDDVFLALTGHRADDQAEEPEDGDA